MAVQLKDELARDETPRNEWLCRKTLLKRIDEYNYMKYTVPAMKEKKARAKAEQGGGRDAATASKST
jgi:hypothetical protein